MQDLIKKIFSVKQCLMAHPDNEQNSEFEDRISDLQDVEDSLKDFVGLDNSPINTNCEETKELLRKFHDHFVWFSKDSNLKNNTTQQLKQCAKILNIV
jgi:hypothetical protein